VTDLKAKTWLGTLPAIVRSMTAIVFANGSPMPYQAVTIKPVPSRVFRVGGRQQHLNERVERTRFAIRDGIALRAAARDLRKLGNWCDAPEVADAEGPPGRMDRKVSSAFSIALDLGDAIKQFDGHGAGILHCFTGH